MRRLREPAALVIVRAVVGVAFLGTGLFKLVGPPAIAADFERWGIPAARLAVPAVGAFEVVCGLLVLLGVRLRVVGALLAVDMLGALLTAGRIDGGEHVVAPLVLGALCLVLVARTASPRRR